MFKERSPLYGDSQPRGTPFQRAAQVWDAREGAARVQAANWRYMAFACATIAAVSLVAYVADRNATHIATYIVPIDPSGQPGEIQLADKAYKPTDAMVGYFVADWVKLTRARSPVDPRLNINNLRKANGFVSERATSEYQDMFQAMVAAGKNPGRVGVSGVDVEIRSVIQRSPATYQVQWSETETANSDKPIVTHWTGLFSTKIVPPKDQAQVFKNPLGLYLTHFTITEENA